MGWMLPRERIPPDGTTFDEERVFFFSFFNAWRAGADEDEMSDGLQNMT